MPYIVYRNVVLSNSPQQSRFELGSGGDCRFMVGSDPTNHLVLNNPCVARFAFELQQVDGDCYLMPQAGVAGCTIGKLPALPGKRYRIENHVEIEIGPYVLSVHGEDDVALEASEARRRLDARVLEVLQAIHKELVPRVPHYGSELEHDARDGAETGTGRKPLEVNSEMIDLEHGIAQIARDCSLLDPELIPHLAALCLRFELLNTVIKVASVEDDPWRGDVSWRRLVTTSPERERELDQARNSLLRALGVVSMTDLGAQVQRVERHFWTVWPNVAACLPHGAVPYLALRHLKKEIKDILFGYGPLEDLLRTPSISEIMVVRSDMIYIEREGVIENSGRRFVSDHVTESIIERIVGLAGARIDRSKPVVDARLRDGSRVNAVIAPVAVSGPCLTIRKFTILKPTIDKLINEGSITPAAAEFLRAAIRFKRNIVVSGATGSGKTTLLNCLSGFIPEKERTITIEDVAELYLTASHVVRLETKPANVEGKGAVTHQDLVRNVTRMRPDRIIVGEVRGPEALDMLQAMNTGHDGSLTTIHANSAQEVVTRLVGLVQQGSTLPEPAIHRQVAAAIHLIVHIRRERDGRRRVVQIAECLGIDPFKGGIRMKDLFAIDETGKLGPTGLLPTFIDELKARNFLDIETFFPGAISSLSRPEPT